MQLNYKPGIPIPPPGPPPEDVLAFVVDVKDTVPDTRMSPSINPEIISVDESSESPVSTVWRKGEVFSKTPAVF